MIKIELTAEQANTLLQLVDIAMKAGGYQQCEGRSTSGYELILEAAKQQAPLAN